MLRCWCPRLAAVNDLVAKFVPGGVHGLVHLDDQELLRNTRRLVGKSNQLFAALLLHLTEVETRGLHRKRLCANSNGGRCRHRHRDQGRWP